MHELSLAQALVEQIQHTAELEHAARVSRIVVVIGAYSGVERSAFELAFPFAAEDTVAEGAELIIEEEPTTATCSQCNSTFIPEPALLLCPRCGSNEITLQGGRQFLIRSMDLEIQ